MIKPPSKPFAIASFVFSLVCSGNALAQGMLYDDFSSGLIDPSRWQVVTAGVPGGSAAVFVQSQQCVLQSRGHLVTAQDFDPVTAGGIRVAGTWRWGATYDYFHVLTRSDGVPGGSYGETQNGIQFQASYESPPYFSLSVRGSLIQLSVPTLIGGFQPVPGVTYSFTMVDTGSAIIATASGPSGESVRLEADVLSDMTSMKRVVFHNREQVLGTPQCFLDDVSIGRQPAARIQTFGSGCSGNNGVLGMTPASGLLPVIGQVFVVQIASVPLSVPNPGFFVPVLPYIGFDITNTGGASLPRDLSPIGMPGCTQYVDPFQVVWLFTPSGSTSWAIQIPNVQGFAGLHAYLQAAAYDPSANPLGLVASNALDATLGW